jgi:lipopolysaccharide export system permease protein
MQGNNIVLIAKSGTMLETADKMYLELTLFDGKSYNDIMNNPKDKQTHPFYRDKFDQRIIRFDLSEFKLTRTKEDLFKGNYQMLNLSQLNYAVDSMQIKNNRRKADFAEQLKKGYYKKTIDLIAVNDSNKTKHVSNINSFAKLNKQQKLTIIQGATNSVRNSKAYADNVGGDFESQQMEVVRYEAEWHRKFTLSIACIVLFFIGAPLGAIIRKGGLGMPVVMSLVFFIFFHIFSITGEKMVKEGTLPAYQGMWMATLIYLPIGIFLTYKATKDSALFDIDAYLNPIKNLFIRKKKGN